MRPLRSDAYGAGGVETNGVVVASRGGEDSRMISGVASGPGCEADVDLSASGRLFTRRQGVVPERAGSSTVPREGGGTWIIFHYGR